MGQEKNSTPKILCIDDSAVIRAVVQMCLRQSGMEVVAAPSGAEGLELMCAEKPDAVLLDMQMPDMDGFETLQRISDDDQISNIPVIFMTADDHVETVNQAMALGARDFIVKPFVHATLAERIVRVLKATPPRGLPTR
jgi:CheY-like chemotaxis protein